jgi:HlyD family secretion protein
MNGRKETYLFAAALPLLLIIAYLGWPISGARQHGAEWASTKAGYEIETVSRGGIRRIVTGSGIVKPLVSVLVGSQVSGQIIAINVEHNSRVKAGDIIAVIDDKAFRSRVAQANSELELARSALKNQEAAMAKAKAFYAHADRSNQRQKILAGMKNTTLVNLEQSQRDLEVAQTEISISSAMIEGAQATVANRGALLEQAQIDLEHTRIRAPIAGVVLSRLIEVGQTVAASLQSPELFRIVQDLTHMQIEAQIGEAEIGGVREEQAVSFGVDAYPDERFSGRVTAIRLAPNVDQNIVSYTVLIDVNNADLRLYPGMTANVKIETARKENVVRIPLDALRFVPDDFASSRVDTDSKPGRKNVWLLNRASGQLEQRFVGLGLGDATHAEIALGDIPEGAQIVVRKRHPEVE